METLINPYRGKGMPGLWPGDPVWPSVDAGAVAALLDRCPAKAETPLRDAPDLARVAKVAAVHLKDERDRLGLGSFKALGAAYVIAKHAAEAGGEPAGALTGRTYVAASAGNHGLSVAAGARLSGARAVIVLAETVPEAFADRLRGKGAEVVRRGAVYEDSMAAAMAMADSEGWTLLSDSSWPGYIEHPHGVMEGYLQLAAEIVDQIEQVPTHVMLQAGVGGMAAAVAAYLRKSWGDGPKIVVVEPEAAPALMESIRAGKVVDSGGPVSNMGRLDCKTPSLIALGGLARDADVFLTVSDGLASQTVERLNALDLATTPSGAAGVAALFASEDVRAAMGLGPASRALAILSEAAG